MIRHSRRLASLLLSLSASALYTAAAVPGQVFEFDGSGTEVVRVPEVTDAVDVACAKWGAEFGAVLRSNGTVIAWGRDAGGTAITAPPGLSSVVKIDAGNEQILALKSDGTAVSFPAISINGYSMQPPVGLDQIVDISSGATRSFAVRKDGTVVGWGEGGQVPSDLVNVKAISAGVGALNLALLKDGTVRSWTSQYWGDAPALPPLSNIIAVAAGYDHGLALRADGTVVGWGTSRGAVVPAGLNDVVEIAAGQNYSLALKKDGTLVTWGSPYYEQNSMAIPASIVAGKAIEAGRAGWAMVVAAPASAEDRELSMDCGNDLSLDPPITVGPTATFVWQKDGKAIPGATQRTFVKLVAQESDSGVYQVQITESGTVTLGPKTTVRMQSGNGRGSYLRNISSRGLAGAGENTMIVGFVCSGAGVRGVVLRAVGPGLSTFVNNYLPDPRMALHDANRKLDENNDWGRRARPT